MTGGNLECVIFSKNAIWIHTLFIYIFSFYWNAIRLLTSCQRGKQECTSCEGCVCEWVVYIFSVNSYTFKITPRRKTAQRFEFINFEHMLVAVLTFSDSVSHVCFERWSNNNTNEKWLWERTGKNRSCTCFFFHVDYIFISKHRH